ncbi:hypothetical protein WICPIJ_000020 [Wickerhamomyces pijperi]|uniref:Ribophorin II C-terminal domain-containing protein n=1 Tax=Wickerhamomyces pijperi TaxID=599730 RepID=A0A9P8TSC9_WICPI|nr:hypothetical protein WICPIJ_000020 [Wickerhamomyces pijperi]
MKIQLLVLFLSTVISAFKITDGTLKSSKQELGFFESDSLRLNSTEENLSVSFKIKSNTKPNQIFVKLTNENGIESSFKPTTKKSGESYISKLSLPFTKLPTLFQASSKLFVSLVIASEEDKYFETVGSIENTPYLISKSTYKPTEKFQAKPEIHHIFNEAPQTVDPSIAVVFSFLSIMTFFTLIVSWGFNGALNFGNFKFDLSHFAFIALIIGYEVTFFFYYLGDSIFTTIGRVAILTGPTVWFGSRLLNYLGELRVAGQR